MCEEVVRKCSVGESQGICEGLLQEEWSADTLGLRGGDRLCAWIYTPVTQPLHTGMDEWMERNSRKDKVTHLGSD